MNKKLNKTVSFMAALAVMGMLYSPGVTANAAEKISDSKLQSQVDMLSNSLDSTKYKVKINNENKVEVYTNEVAKINASAKAASGLKYGSWFGGADSYYAASPSETIKGALVTFAFINPFLSSSSVALTVAKSLAGGFGMTLTVTPGQMLKADRTKRYREVNYSDGSFAYWQTKVGASVSVDNTNYGHAETIVSGGQW